MRQAFPLWLFCVFTYASPPFATIADLERTQHCTAALRLWVSVANEGQSDGFFTDDLLTYDPHSSGHGQLYSWHTCESARVNMSSVSFDACTDETCGSIWRDGIRIFKVNSANFMSEALCSMLRKMFANGELKDDENDEQKSFSNRKIVQWAAHCLFSCEPDEIVVM
jgi:hypothetical protein